MEITESDRRQLASASEAMLRPFEHETPIDYLVAVSAEVMPLVGAFATMCGTSDPEGIVGLGSIHWSEADREDFAKWKLRDEGTNRGLQLKSDVVTMREIVGDDWNGYNNDPMVREWYLPRGIRDLAGYLMQWPEDNALAMMELHHIEFGTPRCGAEGKFLLGLLQPSLRAGMRLFYTVGQFRHAVAHDMDELGVPMCVCGHDGRIYHISSTVRSMLASEPDRQSVLDRIQGVAGQVLAGGLKARRPADHAVHEVVSTASRRYRISAAIASHSMNFGRTDVLVAVSNLDGDTVTALDLAAANNLSSRERQVAQLIGRGLSTRQIADVLELSPHTIKRHTEHVLSKSGLRSRTAVASRLSNS